MYNADISDPCSLQQLARISSKTILKNNPDVIKYANEFICENQEIRNRLFEVLNEGNLEQFSSVFNTLMKRIGEKINPETITKMIGNPYPKLLASYLITSKVADEFMDDNGLPLLFCTMMQGNEDISKWLIRNRINVNTVDQLQQTPLHLAVWESNEKKMVVLLLRSGVDPDVENLHGKTPLAMADNSDHIIQVRELINIPIEIAIERLKNDLTQAWAVEQFLSLLSQYKYVNDIHITNEHGNKFIHSSAYTGHTSIVQFTIDKGVDVNDANENGMRALHFAVIGAKEKVVESLLNIQGVNIDVQDLDGDTPLHFAADVGQAKIGTLLIEKCAKVNIPNNDGETSLHFAASTGNKDLVSECIGHGYEVNAESSDGKSPLCYALQNGHRNIVNLLIENESDISDYEIYDMIGEIPNYDGAKERCKDIAECLVKMYDVHQYRGQYVALLFGIVRANAIDTFCFLSENSIINDEIINARDSDGCTLLHIAGDLGHKDMWEKLILCGADKCAKDGDDNVPHLLDYTESSEKIIKECQLLMERNYTKQGETSSHNVEPIPPSIEQFAQLKIFPSASTGPSARVPRSSPFDSSERKSTGQNDKVSSESPNLVSSSTSRSLKRISPEQDENSSPNARSTTSLAKRIKQLKFTSPTSGPSSRMFSVNIERPSCSRAIRFE